MLLTYGHGTDSAERTVAVLAGAGVAALIDIRTAPGSRRNPGLSSEDLAVSFPAAGIGYHWEPRLGGRRRLPPAGSTPCRNRLRARCARWRRS